MGRLKTKQEMVQGELSRWGLDEEVRCGKIQNQRNLQGEVQILELEAFEATFGSLMNLALKPEGVGSCETYSQRNLQSKDQNQKKPRDHVLEPKGSGQNERQGQELGAVRSRNKETYKTRSRTRCFEG